MKYGTHEIIVESKWETSKIIEIHTRIDTRRYEFVRHVVVDKLRSITGVTHVTVAQYEITVAFARMFTADEVFPQVKDIVIRLMPRIN